MENQNLPASQKLNVALEALKSELKKIELINTSSTKTNGQFKFNPNQNNVTTDITKVKNIVELIEISSFLLSKQGMYDKAASVIGLTAFPPFKWQNYSLEDWIHDLRIQASVVSQFTRESELKKDISDLESLLSTEEKRILTINRIAEKYKM